MAGVCIALIRSFYGVIAVPIGHIGLPRLKKRLGACRRFDADCAPRMFPSLNVIYSRSMFFNAVYGQGRLTYELSKMISIRLCIFIVFCLFWVLLYVRKAVKYRVRSRKHR